jgi:glycosyltransferase involved in cell wall biosynthesis
MPQGLVVDPTQDRCTESASPYRVVFVTGGAAMAGVEFNAVRLAERLDRSRWEVVLVCPEEGDLPAAFRRLGLRMCILPRGRMFSSSIPLTARWRLPNPLALAWDMGVILKSSGSLNQLLGELRPDLVVTKGLFPHFYGGLAARRRGVPCLWHMEDFISERWFGLFRRGMSQVARRLPTAVAAIGEPVAGQFPASMREKIRVIHNGADTQTFRPGLDGTPVRRELGIPADALVVGHVARLTPWKGQRPLLEAFARIAPHTPQARLLLVGSPVFDTGAYERTLRARAAELGLADRVVFAGYRRDIPQVLAAMDVLAYPSIEKDNCPLALLEGMASGLPTVAFDIPGVRLVLPGPNDGILTPVKEIGPLAEALGRLLSDEGLRQRLGRGARRRIEEAFSLELHARRFEEAFLELIGTAELRATSEAVMRRECGNTAQGV